MRFVERNNSKRWLIGFLLMMILQSRIVFAIPSEVDSIEGETAIVMDAVSGDILFNKHMHQKMYPASTTKMMTALIVLENCSLEDKVTVAKDAAGIGGSSIYLREGEVFTVEQLLYGLLVPSGNDAAVALAIYTAGDVASFVELMNKKAQSVGALNTHFTNPNGLPDPNHYTTAYDLAQIAKVAIKQPTLMKIAGTARYQIPPTNKTPETRYLKNSNRFLWATGSGNKINYLGKLIDIKYNDVIKGIKTGYTKAAGNCLVSLGALDEQKVISVVLKSSGNYLYQDTRSLVDYGLYNFKTVYLLNEGEISGFVEVLKGRTSVVGVVSDRTLIKSVPIEQISAIKQEVMIPDNVIAPIKSGEVIGLVTYTLDGQPLGKAQLVAGQDVLRRRLWWPFSGLLLLLFSARQFWLKRRFKNPYSK